MHHLTAFDRGLLCSIKFASMSIKADMEKYTQDTPKMMKDSSKVIKTKSSWQRQ